MKFGFGKRKNAPDAESPRLKELLEIIRALKPGELIEVIWIDACISRDRKVSALRNHDFATYKKTPGYFCALANDHRYNQYHLILAIEETDGFDEKARYDITSIPLSIVMSIKPQKQGQVTDKGRHVLRVPIKMIKMKRAQVKKLDRFGEKIILEPEEKGV